MGTILIGLTPMMLAYLTYCMVGLPGRTGRTRKRWRSLGQCYSESGAVDVSCEAAARLIAGRLSVIVEAAFLVFIFWLAVASGVPRFVAILIILAIVWVVARTYKFANFFYYVLTLHISSSMSPASSICYPLGAMKGASRRLLRRWFPDIALILLGIVICTSAGLGWAYDSNALATGIPGLYIRHTGLNPIITLVIELAFGLVLIAAGMSLDRRRRRTAMLGVEDVQQAIKSQKPSILFLRQFGAEEKLIPCHAAPRDTVPFINLIPRRSIYLEDAITWLCWAWGPVLSISDPRRRTERTLGAARYRVGGDHDWQRTVSDLVNDAKLIIVICGDSEGVRWEIDEILRRPEWTEKTLFINPDPHTPDALESVLPTRIPPRRDRLLLAATFDSGRVNPVWSTLAEDVDYEVAVELMARKVQLAEDIVVRSVARQG